jgi:hypothetical protein
MHYGLLQSTVRSALEDLANGRFEAIVKRAVTSRLTAEQLRQVICNYGRTPVSPPGEVVQELDAVQVRDTELPTWSVRTPLWTREEGRSDLTLELTITIDGATAKFELDDLHVL